VSDSVKSVHTQGCTLEYRYSTVLYNVNLLNNERVLRDDHLLNIPFVRLDHYLKFPLSDYPRLWNEFNFAVASNSRVSVKNLLKEHILEKLSNIANCNRLLCPTCHL
jgi:hypothetical protein